MNRYATSSAAALQADGLSDHAGCFVSGAGAPVVMLHSSLGSKGQWTALANRLAPRFQVIALDLCGYGDNAMHGASTPFTLDDEVRLVEAHLDRLVEPRQRVHLVGHSYGGAVALRFAHSRSDRVASLSLYEPVAFRMLDDDDAALADVAWIAESGLRLLEAGRRHDAARVFVDFWSGDGSFASLSLPAQAALARRIDKVPLDFEATWRWPLHRGDLRAIAAPTLLLAGTRSPAVAQRIITRLTQVLPNRRAAWLDAGHMGPITEAHRINPWIEAFVDVCAERDPALPASRQDVRIRDEFRSPMRGRHEQHEVL